MKDTDIGWIGNAKGAFRALTVFEDEASLGIVLNKFLDGWKCRPEHRLDFVAGAVFDANQTTLGGASKRMLRS